MNAKLLADAARVLRALAPPSAPPASDANGVWLPPDLYKTACALDALIHSTPDMSGDLRDVRLTGGHKKISDAVRAALAAAPRDERRMTKHQRDWLAEAQLDLRTFGQHKGWCAILPVDSCEDCNCGLQSAHVRAAAALTADAAAAPRDRPEAWTSPRMQLAPLDLLALATERSPQDQLGRDTAFDLRSLAQHLAAVAPRDERAQGFTEGISAAVRIVEERGSQFESASYLADRFQGLASALRCLAPAASRDERSDALWQLKRVTDYLDSANILLRDANPEDAEECDEAAAVVAEARAYLDDAAAPLGAPVARLDEVLHSMAVAYDNDHRDYCDKGDETPDCGGCRADTNMWSDFRLRVFGSADPHTARDAVAHLAKLTSAPAASLEVEALDALQLFMDETRIWTEQSQARIRARALLLKVGRHD